VLVPCYKIFFTISDCRYFPHFHKVLFFLLGIIFISSCSKKVQPAALAPVQTESYTTADINKLLEEKSAITINYSISKKAIRDTFQFIVDSVFKEDWIIDEYKIKSKLTRAGEMVVEMNNKDILVELPLFITISKGTFLGNVDASGEVKMSFIAKLDIDTLWNLQTATKLVSHEWTKKPKLNIVGLNLPFESVSNIIINRAKKIIEEGIDQSIRESFNLRSMIMDVTKNYAKPHKIHDLYGGWFYMIPDSAYLSGVVNKQSTINGKIMLTAKTRVTSTESKNIIFPKTPKVRWSDRIKDSSNISLVMDLGYDFLDSLANESIKGQTFEEGGKSITVQSVKVGPLGNKLQITAKVSGSLNGDIILAGTPVYDKYLKILKINDISLSVRSKNVLVSAAAWLLKGKIHRELLKMSEFPLDQKIKDAQKILDKMVDDYYQPYKMQVTASVGNPEIPLFQTKADHLAAGIKFNLYIHALFKDLSFFRG
jgi:hypothetical protein